MPVSFSRLRILGFKSFADPVTVEIRPGLTGIVGPNGCGKSNVVEALRWAMGETSARALRGGEMDDVIFAGTAARASRNIGEVTLVLDETAGHLPPPFHEAPELEISRRITRGEGSVYRINGREARARDVQTLFADMATGAHSSGMVSQGRVASIVNARPDERRAILEEAAGITGLHARRHEAELKLRAAEANLGRAEDLRGQLEAQLDGLRRQARQANRYRNISGAIRAAEAELLAIQRAIVVMARDEAAAARHEAAAAVAEATGAAAQAATRATQAAAVLPDLRRIEGEARTALERHRLAGEAIGQEAARAEAALSAAADRLAQLESDVGYAAQARAEAVATIARLTQEAAQLAAETEAHPPRLARAQADLTDATAAMRAAETAADRATERAADLSARHRALHETLTAVRARANRLAAQSAQIATERDEVAARLVDPAHLAEAIEATTQAVTTLNEARVALEHAEAARDAARRDGQARRLAAQADAQQARSAAHADAQSRRAAAEQDGQRRRAEVQEAGRQARAAVLAAGETARAEARTALTAARKTATNAAALLVRLDVERQALADILAVQDGEAWPRMVDQLTVPAGLEAALGAALGEELDSAANAEAARHWRELPPLEPPPLPSGATKLASLVQAPSALARALSQIGLVEHGAAQQAELRPGQTLVCRDGGLWRWDGYCMQPGTATAAAVRLQQRNRLAELRAATTTAKADADITSAAQLHAEAEDVRVRSATEAEEQAVHANAILADTDVQAATRAAEQGVRHETEAAEAAARVGADTAEATVREQADRAERDATAAELRARASRQQAEQAHTAAASRATRLDAQAQAATARLAGLAEQAGRLGAESAEANATLAQSETEAAALADPASGRAAMEEARAVLSGIRLRVATAQGDHDALVRSASGRAHRSRAVAAEADAAKRQDVETACRLGDVTQRRDAARVEHQALQAAPAEIAARRSSALDTLAAAEGAHRHNAEILTAAEAEMVQADRAGRAADAALATGREAVARREGDAVAAEQAFAAVMERIAERLGAGAALPDPPALLSVDTEDKARRKLERLQREREEMGPVNLRAEAEAAEIGTQIDVIMRERDELGTAIAKLRGSIGHLNREGRERLAQVFADVDRHFQQLFARMFGGGRAHLALVGSDDPLLAGLEIYAQPPGKKLATLSLLSGGEQALTALSLIFAVFRCNPAPVCVLDEVDAPLDDANTERFCTLLEDMTRETATRFLVVTHQHITMARMDRLYGVTMQERGVSRLLSVDLQRAAEMVDVPRMAAE